MYVGGVFLYSSILTVVRRRWSYGNISLQGGEGMANTHRGNKEALQEKMNRIELKQGDLQVSRKLAEYIEMLETYLVELEDRVVGLETMLGLRGIDLSQFE